VDAVVGPGARRAWASRSGVARLDEQPRGPPLGQRPTALAITARRRRGRQAGSAAASLTTGWTAARPPPQAGDLGRGGGRVMEESPTRRRRRRRDRGAIVRAGADEEDRGGHGRTSRGGADGRPRRAGPARRAGAQVVARVVAPSVDEVALGDPEALPVGRQGRALGVADLGPSIEKGANAGRPRGGSPGGATAGCGAAASPRGRRRRSPPSPHGIAEELGPQPLSEAGRWERWYSSGSSHGARSSSVATTGSPARGAGRRRRHGPPRDPGWRWPPRPLPSAAARTRNGSSVSAPNGTGALWAVFAYRHGQSGELRGGSSAPDQHDDERLVGQWSAAKAPRRPRR